MKPRSISETQRLRALTLGIKPVLPPREEKPKPVVYRTDRGCRVESLVTATGEHVTLSCGLTSV